MLDEIARMTYDKENFLVLGGSQGSTRQERGHNRDKRVQSGEAVVDR